MNRGVTIGYGEAGPRVLVGPEIPLREHIRGAKGMIAGDAPGIGEIEVWSRDSGLVKRRRLRAAATTATGAQETVAPAEPPLAGDEESPVAEAAPKRKASRKTR